MRGLQAGLVLGKSDKEKLNIAALIGSGMYWAWFDALFMGVFFISGNAGHLPEMAAVFTFLVAALVYASVFLAEEKVRKVLEGKPPWWLLAFSASSVRSFSLLLA